MKKIFLFFLVFVSMNVEMQSCFAEIPSSWIELEDAADTACGQDGNMKTSANKLLDSMSQTPPATYKDMLLVWSAQQGNVSRINCLMKRGANVDIQRPDGWTALMKAVAEGNVASARALLAHGANPNMQNGLGITALHFARRYGFKTLEKMLRDNGAKGNIRDSVRNLSADEIQVEQSMGINGRGERNR